MTRIAVLPSISRALAINSPLFFYNFLRCILTACPLLSRPGHVTSHPPILLRPSHETSMHAKSMPANHPPHCTASQITTPPHLPLPPLRSGLVPPSLSDSKRHRNRDVLAEIIIPPYPTQHKKYSTAQHSQRGPICHSTSPRHATSRQARPREAIPAATCENRHQRTEHTSTQRRLHSK